MQKGLTVNFHFTQARAELPDLFKTRTSSRDEFKNDEDKFSLLWYGKNISAGHRSVQKIYALL
jgi:hypothetical protein